MRLIKKIYFLVLIFFVLIAAFAPALHPHYIYHDEVKNFLITPFRTFIPDHYQDVFCGRPLSAMLLTAKGLLVHQVSDLAVIRLFYLFILSLAAWILTGWLETHGVRTLQALLLALLIFTLPPFQVMVAFMGSCQPIAVLTAVYSAKFAKTMPLGKNAGKRFLSRSAGMSIGLLFAALLIYPPHAMYYWVMAAIVLLSFNKESFDHWGGVLTNLFYAGFGALGIYGLVLMATKPYFADLTIGGYNPYVSAMDVAGKLRWFFKEPLVNALNLWNIFPERKTAYAAGGFILAACLLQIGRAYKDIKEERIQKKQIYVVCLSFCLFVILVFLTFLPNLAAGVHAAHYRCLAGLMSMVVLTIFWAVQKWLVFVPKPVRETVLTILLILSCFGGVVSAHRNLYAYRVKPSIAEFEYLKDKISAVPLDELKEIHIIRPDVSKLKSRYDEFGTPTTFFHHNISAMVTVILRELNKGKMTIYDIGYDSKSQADIYTFQDRMDPGRRYTYSIKISHSPRRNIPQIGGPVTVIDMTELYKSGRELNYLHL